MSRFTDVKRVLEEQLSTPYEYGLGDCFILGCAMIDALEGTSFVKKYTGHYTTLAGAQKALRKKGFKSLVDFFEVELDRKSSGPASAQIGDIGIVNIDGAEHVAINQGFRFVSKVETGKRYFDISDVVAVFHLGK